MPLEEPKITLKLNKEEKEKGFVSCSGPSGIVLRRITNSLSLFS